MRDALVEELVLIAGGAIVFGIAGCKALTKWIEARKAGKRPPLL